MSWELHIDIDLDDLSDGPQLATAMIKTAGPALDKLTYFEYGSGWDSQTTPLLAEQPLDPKDDHTVLLSERVSRLRGADRVIELELCMQIQDIEMHRRPVYCYIFGTEHTGLSQYRRRANAMIDFGNRQRWKGTDNLITEEPADERFLVRWLTAICDQAQPKSMYFVAEEDVSIPFNYHLVYHNHLQGHADDLREIARIALTGGRGYPDGRSKYPPLLDIPGESMMFCRRAGMRLDDLKGELRDKRRLLQELVDGLEVPDETIEIAALATNCIEPMDTKDHNDGLGIVGEPFLRDYCENFYLHMLHRLAT